MPPSPRYTVRLPHALDALVQARVATGTPFAVRIREALSAYFADSMPTPADSPPTARAPTPADSADLVRVLGEQLAILRVRVEALESVLTQRRHPADQRADSPADTRADTQPTPADTPRGTYDPQAAVARMQALRTQGYSFARIAAQLTAEGIPTRYGLPWQHSSVRHLLKTYGEG
jgi:hypothetical protein